MEDPFDQDDWDNTTKFTAEGVCQARPAAPARAPACAACRAVLTEHARLTAHVCQAGRQQAPRAAAGTPRAALQPCDVAVEAGGGACVQQVVGGGSTLTLP